MARDKFSRNYGTEIKRALLCTVICKNTALFTPDMAVAMCVYLVTIKRCARANSAMFFQLDLFVGQKSVPSSINKKKHFNTHSESSMY